jgi:hypothetical protein
MIDIVKRFLVWALTAGLTLPAFFHLLLVGLVLTPYWLLGKPESSRILGIAALALLMTWVRFVVPVVRQRLVPRWWRVLLAGVVSLLLTVSLPFAYFFAHLRFGFPHIGPDSCDFYLGRALLSDIRACTGWNGTFMQARNSLYRASGAPRPGVCERIKAYAAQDPGNEEVETCDSESGRGWHGVPCPNFGLDQKWHCALCTYKAKSHDDFERLIAASPDCGQAAAHWSANNSLGHDPAVDMVGSVQVSCPRLATLNEKERLVFERHLRGSPVWTVHRNLDNQQEADVFAVKERGKDGPYTDTVVHLTPHRFPASNTENRVAAMAGQVVVESVWRGTEDFYRSDLLIEGGAGVSALITEFGPPQRRPLTQRALNSLCQEVTTALKHRTEILGSGRAPATDQDAPRRPRNPSMEVVSDRPAAVSAWINPGEDGTTYLKVVAIDPILKSGKGPALPSGHVMSPPLTARLTGWSHDPQILFPYRARVWRLEGSRHRPYRARFELWFEPKAGGPTRKVMETVASVTGWDD